MILLTQDFPLPDHRVMLIDGTAIAKLIRDELKIIVSGISGRKPCLAVLLVGDNPASRIYVRRKTQACIEAGMHSIKKELPETLSEIELIHEISKLNQDPSIDGILVQLPLPPHINTHRITEAILPHKDVDGFHPLNAGKLLIGDSTGFVPCTPLGIQTLLLHCGIDTAGKNALIIGRSNIVGKPMAALLMANGKGGNATVSVVHSRTKDIKKFCLEADILIAAIGKPHFITADMVKEGAVVIDVGINKIPDPSIAGALKLVGDVDFENVKEKCAFITPVPGGVGPMTIAMLLKNTLKSYFLRE